MATIKNITNNVFDSILPVYGNQRTNLPIWNESQKMFITSEYESSSGNRYYKGIRFSERLVIIEKVGLYHTWTYIDDIELYTFDGRKPVMIGKKAFDKQFYDAGFIRAEVSKMLSDYLKSQLIQTDSTVNAEQLQAHTTEWLNGCYRSFLYDNQQLALENMMPLLSSND